MMASTQQPEWLRKNEDLSASLVRNDTGDLTVSSASSSIIEQKQQSNSIFSRKTVFVQYALRIATMMICILMAATALIGLSCIHGVESTGRIFVAIYMFLFAGLLFVFEGVQMRNIEYLDHIYRRNFGFMYNSLAKSFFIIFIGFLSFGLGEPSTLSFCNGLIFAGFGAGELALFLKFPELFEQEPS